MVQFENIRRCPDTVTDLDFLQLPATCDVMAPRQVTWSGSHANRLRWLCSWIEESAHIDMPCAASTHVRYRAAKVSMNRLKLRRKKDMEVKPGPGFMAGLMITI